MWIKDLFKKKVSNNDSTYYDNCEKVGIQRGISMDCFLKVVGLVKKMLNGDNSLETRQEFKTAISEYHKEEKKAEQMEKELNIY